ncbi:hypothetical protein [Amycolatopsis sp. NPDC059657]|uniref:bestrophin-like domain n=1 Tax=Amycolatopsis sp. NPDC059657 TaxID=3346899 RepID=UPI00366CAD23
MNIYVSGILWVAGAAVAAAVVGYLVRRFGWDEGRAENNDAAGQVFTIVAGLQAVLVAFVLIAQFDTVKSTQDGATLEADSLVAATWASDALGDTTKDKVRTLAAAYSKTVAQQEWPRMRDGGKVPDTGWGQLEQMRKAVAEAPAEEDWVKDRKIEATNQLWQVYQAREARIAAAKDAGVGAVVWFALILGTIVTVLLPNLFGGTKLAAHVIIVSTLAGTITLLLFAIYQLQNPFTGGARIGPDAISTALDRLS